MPHRLGYYLTLLGILTLSLLVGGCEGSDIIVIGHPPHDPGHGEEIVLVDDEATIAEIDAACALSFSSDRAEHLSRIARRGDLGPAAQVCLVDAAYDVLSFEDQKVNVLTSLIKNRTFCAEAKSQVLARLEELKFNSNKKSILSALDRKGPVVIFPNEVARNDLTM
jgi:hypothetical protein